MHKVRVYVDTSVIGGTQDEEFAGPSKRFFDQVRKFNGVNAIKGCHALDIRGPMEIYYDSEDEDI
ncbi:MAG: hypothetical protein QGH60_19655 [Phycisphaerae bacterium]|jgi:hypothetical protein|nr:hypothetical protein [Phycisphaerae bacterium]